MAFNLIVEVKLGSLALPTLERGKVAKQLPRKPLNGTEMRGSPQTSRCELGP